MAVLDYAFVADFAKVEPNGTLTAIGASWTFVQANTLPSVHRMAVAGRIRGKVGEVPIAIRVDVWGPDDTFRLAAEAQLGPSTKARPYGDGFVGHLFALDLQIPLPAVGLYVIYIDLDGERARRLAFDVVKAPEDA